MICPRCGSEVADGAKFCPRCGTNLDAQSFEYKANGTIESFANSTQQEVQNVIDDVRGGYYGTPNVGRLETNRSLLTYILLNFITCGIYSFFFFYSLARDVNTACDGDGQKTPGLAEYILFSFLTCGIYAIFWQYNLGNRLAEGSRRYGMHFSENGTTVLMWLLFGTFICGIGPFVSMNILIKNTNRICDAYNVANGLY